MELFDWVTSRVGPSRHGTCNHDVARTQNLLVRRLKFDVCRQVKMAPKNKLHIVFNGRQGNIDDAMTKYTLTSFMSVELLYIQYFW
jgi:hypothetical protein